MYFFQIQQTIEEKIKLKFNTSEKTMFYPCSRIKSAKNVSLDEKRF